MTKLQQEYVRLSMDKSRRFLTEPK